MIEIKKGGNENAIHENRKTVTALAIIGGLMMTTPRTEVGASSLEGRAALTYTAYSLGPLGKNNYTNYHAKTTSDQYILNRVIALDNASSVKFWAQTDSAKTISSTYTQRVSTSSTQINFTKSVSKGSNVRLAMQNANSLATYYGFVSGSVDFR